MRTSSAGIDLIKKFEGCRLKAYRLPGEKLYTVGYGHSGPDVAPDATITQEKAEEYLRSDLEKFERYVEQYVKIPLTQSQFDALVSYCYNRGPRGLKQLADASKTAEDYATNLVVLWGTAKRYKTALLKRRLAEQKLFRAGMKVTEDIAREVIAGEWGNGKAREVALEAAGWDYEMVQEEVNRILKEGEA